MGKRHSKVKRPSKYGDTRSERPVCNDVQKLTTIHSDNVTCVDKVGPGISISGSADKTIVQYNWLENKVQQKWIGHDRDVTRVVYGSKVNGVFSASRDRTVYLWQCGGAQNTPIRKYQGHDLVVMGTTINPDNTLLCTGSRDNYIKLWDVETGICSLQRHISRNLITYVKWISHEESVAQTSEDKCLRIWDTRTLEESHVFPKKQYIQTCCDVSSDGNYCVTSSNGFDGQGCETTLWDLRQNRGVCEYKGHNQTTGCCLFLPSIPYQPAPLIATSSHDSTVKIWNRDTKECVCSLSLDGAGPLTSLTAYEDGSICCASFNSGIHLLCLMADASGQLTLTKKAQY
ncbi:WD repeat-containing protein 31-like [Ptychodera flava]|uniref:WD repeat-containing protein 31-like n=1 Tax=Ptychodera flava TaxID=63121 RepID=UPI00396A444D